MDLSHDELVFLINLKWPDAVHGRDFWVGQPVHENSNVRSGPAFIAAWNVDGSEKPEDAEIQALYDAHKAELTEVRRQRELAVIREAIDQECDRRVADGFVFKGQVYQSRPKDQKRFNGAASAAGFAVMAGAATGDYRWHGEDTDFEWIAKDNTKHRMDAHDMFALGKAAMAHEQAHVFAARQIKDMDPIPTDYENDSYWPD